MSTCYILISPLAYHYIRQVNGVNWRILCDALFCPSVRPSVCTQKLWEKRQGSDLCVWGDRDKPRPGIDHRTHDMQSKVQCLTVGATTAQST